MRVLIVEDNSFNAFCLTRLFEAVCANVQITVAADSLEALKAIDSHKPHLVILDGNLEAEDGRCCNGPVLADLIWRIYPKQAIVAWTDNQEMKSKFFEVFKTHLKAFNEVTYWPKAVDHKKLLQSLSALSLKHDLGYFGATYETYNIERLYA